MPRFELYKSDDKRAKSKGSSARMFAIMLLLWAAIFLWASQALLGL
ncbi:MAG TPA: hypothetical protein VIO94_02195 [Phenylobacterium sp.]